MNDMVDNNDDNDIDLWWYSKGKKASNKLKLIRLNVCLCECNVYVCNYVCFCMFNFDT